MSNRHPGLRAQVRQHDITISTHELDLAPVDIVFTQAVIMHIQRNYINALANLFHVARSQVVLMENWKRHEFMKDIQWLFDQHQLPWKSIYFYYRVSDVLRKAHLMIVSEQPLSQYPVLETYETLRETVSAI